MNRMINAGRLGILLVMGFAPALAAQQSGATAYVTVRLPEGVQLRLPSNWRILTEDSRIALNARTDALLREVNAERLPSSLPFAANFYDDDRKTAGILNVRYYPSAHQSQQDVRSLTPDVLSEFDSMLRTQLTTAVAASGSRLVQWLGTTERDIDGMRFLVSIYRRTSKFGGTFRVRLLRMLDGRQSYTVTLSYREDERQLIPVIENMAASMRIDRSRR